MRSLWRIMTRHRPRRRPRASPLRGGLRGVGRLVIVQYGAVYAGLVPRGPAGLKHLPQGKDIIMGWSYDRRGTHFEKGW
jgi:hypothetical protein